MSILYKVSITIFYLWLKLFHSLKIVGKKNVPKKGAMICVSNHVSMIDPPVVGATCFRTMSFMAKEELFNDKNWGWWFKGCNCISISRNKKDFRATKEAIRRLKNGRAVALFPEGTRSETGNLKQAEDGAAFLSAMTGAAVIPIYVAGTDKVMPKGSKYKKFLPIAAYIGEPVDFSGVEKITDRREKYEFMSGRIMLAIKALKDKAS